MPYEGLKSADLRKGVKALDAALDERDRYTRDHGYRLVRLAAATASLCGMDEEAINTLKVAALFHDIGKIGIPDSVLLKPGKLTSEEWEVIKTHSARGERIVMALEIGDGHDAAHLIRHHHEYFNGDGYPDGLSGEDIPFGSRIISVVDSYDAMTTTRSYAQAKTPEQALSIMHDEEGEKSDPYVFRKFLDVVNNK